MSFYIARYFTLHDAVYETEDVSAKAEKAIVVAFETVHMIDIALFRLQGSKACALG